MHTRSGFFLHVIFFIILSSILNSKLTCHSVVNWNMLLQNWLNLFWIKIGRHVHVFLKPINALCVNCFTFLGLFLSSQSLRIENTCNTPVSGVLFRFFSHLPITWTPNTSNLEFEDCRSLFYLYISLPCSPTLKVVILRVFQLMKSKVMIVWTVTQILYLGKN